MNKRHELYQEDLDYALGVSGIEKIRNKSFLVTGATGLIGVFLIDALMKYNSLGANIRIWAVGRSIQKAESRLGEYFGNPLFNFIEQDVVDPFPDSLKVDYIIPLASNTHPLAYSKFPIETILINVKGCENALNKAYQCNAEVIYPSSVEIYGNATGQTSFKENTNGILNLSTSRSCYTESKRLSESLCQSFLSERGVSSKIVRLSRVFGPTMLESDSKASSQFINKAIAGEDIVLKSDGNQFYSYTYVSEAVKSILHVLVNGQVGEAYNVCSDKCNIHLKEFASICAEAAGREVVFDLPSQEEMKGYSIATTAVMDNTKLVNSGLNLDLSMQDCLLRTIRILTEK